MGVPSSFQAVWESPPKQQLCLLSLSMSRWRISSMPGVSTPAAKRAGASTSFQLERGWRAAGEAGEQGERLERSWREAGGRLEGGWRETGERLLSLSALAPCCCCFSSLALLPHHAAAASPLSLRAPAWDRLQTIVHLHVTAVGFEPMPLRNGALSHRLRPLGQTVLMKPSR